MKKTVIHIILLAMAVIPLILEAKENTTRKNLTPKQTDVEMTELVTDSVKVTDALKFREKIVVMRGYSKSAGASKESFMLTNCSNLHLSSLEVVFRYTDMDGVLVHERTENILCNLPPYSSRQVSIKTFDEGKRFYYHKSKSRKGAIAYDVTIRINSYSVKVSCE